MSAKYINKTVMHKLSAISASLSDTVTGAYVSVGESIGEIQAVVTHTALAATKTLTVQIFKAKAVAGTGAEKIAETVYTEGAGTPAAGVITLAAQPDPDFEFYNVKIITDNTSAIAVAGVLEGNLRYAG